MHAHVQIALNQSYNDLQYPQTTLLPSSPLLDSPHYAFSTEPDAKAKWSNQANSKMADDQ